MKPLHKIFFAVLLIIAIVNVVGWALCASKSPIIEYIEIPAKPEILIIEETTEVEVEAPAYYASIAESITQDEIELLAKLVAAEARNQSLLGQRAVVTVVFNRVLSDKFPNTIEEVIYQDKPVLQFSPSKRLHKITPTEEQYEAVYMTLRDVQPVLPPDVLFFSTGKNGRSPYEKIGDHYFCY